MGNNKMGTMKRKLSSEAAGTLVALRDLRNIKSFSQECGEELCTGGFAVQKGHHLVITDKGSRKADKLYIEISAGTSAYTSNYEDADREQPPAS